MKILKFEGATMRDAVAKVKAQLGDDAVIMATRQVRRGLLGTGYEISAAVDDDEPAPPPALGAAAAAPPAPRPEDLERVLAPFRSELRSLRALIRAAGDHRPDTELRSELQQLRRLVEASAAATRGPTGRPSEPTVVAPSLARVVTLVGPTGAGKTTTIAKLAARAALVDGKRVQLVTLDDYRVGGVDQIRTFAELIGIPLRVVKDVAGLTEAIELDADLVLVDTAGRSPRDTAAIGELAALLAAAPPMEVHVTVPAATPAAGIDKLVRLYRDFAPARLLFTKLDEVDAAPELIDAPRRLRLPVTWITTGQAVPEDLAEPSAEELAHLATHGLPDVRTGRAA